MKKFTLLLLATLLHVCVAAAQGAPPKEYVTISFTPNNHDWVYRVGESVELEVAVIKNNCPIKDIEVSYQWGIEKSAPEVKDKFNSGKQGVKTLSLKGLSKPGFMTCTATVNVDGKSYRNYINIAFEPDKIETVTSLPADFMEFWQGAIADARRVPLSPTLTLQPELCTPEANYYHIRFQNTAEGSYIYGMLSVPVDAATSNKKYPTVLTVPGAGVRAYRGDKGELSRSGVVTLQIGIHGVPVNLSDGVYQDLKATALAGYNSFGIDDKDRYYYKRVYVGCVKALDFLCSLPYVDQELLAVTGGSQGGALSIATAALDKRVKCLAVRHPALCQIAGYYRGSIGGWPNLYRNDKETNITAKIETMDYYDTVNFARFVSVPGFYIWGYNDNVCAPTSMFAAYNEIEAQKSLVIHHDCAHWTYPEEVALRNKFLLKQLGVE